MQLRLITVTGICLKSAVSSEAILTLNIRSQFPFIRPPDISRKGLKFYAWTFFFFPEPTTKGMMEANCLQFQPGGGEFFAPLGIVI